ncbi:hypothetical protein BDV19DRAFT_187604 [Aspergillus venezuelensis]
MMYMCRKVKELRCSISPSHEIKREIMMHGFLPQASLLRHSVGMRLKDVSRYRALYL